MASRTTPPCEAVRLPLPGYRVPVSWHSPLDSINITLKAWIPPRTTEDDVVQAFPRDRRTFVSFFAFYNRHPMYLRALGQRLDTRQAQGLHRLLWLNHEGSEDGLFTLPALEDMAHAERWPVPGVIHAVYPNHFAWSPQLVCENAQRRVHRPDRL